MAFKMKGEHWSVNYMIVEGVFPGKEDGSVSMMTAHDRLGYLERYWSRDYLHSVLAGRTLGEVESSLDDRTESPLTVNRLIAARRNDLCLILNWCF